MHAVWEKIDGRWLIVGLHNLENREDDDDGDDNGEDIGSWGVRVSETDWGWGGGGELVCVLVIECVIPFGLLAKGCWDHVSLLISKCIWAQSRRITRPLLWPGRWLEPQCRPRLTQSTLSRPGVKLSERTSGFWSSLDTKSQPPLRGMCSLHNRISLTASLCQVEGGMKPVNKIYLQNIG